MIMAGLMISIFKDRDYLVLAAKYWPDAKI